MKKLFLILITAVALLFTACDTEEEKAIDNQTEIPADTDDPVIDIPKYNWITYYSTEYYGKVKEPICNIYYGGRSPFYKITYYWNDDQITEYGYCSTNWYQGVYFCVDDLNYIVIEEKDSSLEKITLSSNVFADIIKNSGFCEVYTFGILESGALLIEPDKSSNGICQFYPFDDRAWILHPVRFNLADDIISYQVNYGSDDAVVYSSTFTEDFNNYYFEQDSIVSICLKHKSEWICINRDTLTELLTLPSTRTINTENSKYEVSFYWVGNNIYGKASYQTSSGEIHLDPVLLATIEE